MEDESPNRANGELVGLDGLRRRHMLKLGMYAAYTAPALLAMATAAKAQIGSDEGGGICDPFEDPNCP